MYLSCCIMVLYSHSCVMQSYYEECICDFQTDLHIQVVVNFTNYDGGSLGSTGVSCNVCAITIWPAEVRTHKYLMSTRFLSSGVELTMNINICDHAYENQPCGHKLHLVIFLNQAHAWFLEIALVRTLVCVSVCLCVHLWGH